MDEKIIQSWTAQELIKHTYHELNQRANISLGFIRLLTDDIDYAITDPDKREFAERVKSELEIIDKTVQWLRVWGASNM